MKRKTLKRKISIVGILVFVSMIVYSCWQDEWSSNVTDEVIFDSNKELTIAKAEQWYNATNPSATTVRSLSADGRIPAKPNWNKAKESRKGDLVYLANLHTSFLCNLIYPTFSRILLYSC